MLSHLNSNILNIIAKKLTYKERCNLSNTLFPNNCDKQQHEKRIDYIIDKLYYKIIISDLGYEIYNKNGTLIELERLKLINNFNIKIYSKIIIDFKSIINDINYNCIVDFLQEIIKSNIIIYKISVKKYVDTRYDIYYLFYDKIYNIINIIDKTKIKSFTIKNSNWYDKIGSLNWNMDLIFIENNYNNTNSLKDENGIFYTSKLDLSIIKKFNNLKKLKIKDCYIEETNIDNKLINIFSKLQKIEIIDSHFIHQREYINLINLITNNKFIKNINLNEIFIRDVDHIHWRYDIKNYNVRYNSLTKLLNNLNYNKLNYIKLNVTEITNNNEYLDIILKKNCIDNNIDLSKIIFI